MTDRQKTDREIVWQARDELGYLMAGCDLSSNTIEYFRKAIRIAKEGLIAREELDRLKKA